MEHKKAITVLEKLMKKDILDAEEKEAVFTAIGLLGWASLAKRKKKDPDKDAKW